MILDSTSVEEGVRAGADSAVGDMGRPVLINALRDRAVPDVAGPSGDDTTCIFTTIGVLVAATSGVVAFANERFVSPQATSTRESVMSAAKTLRVMYG